MDKLDDKDIREILLLKLQKYKNTVIYEEFTTPSGKARADVVTVNGRINGYEIKSDFDTLVRLPQQIEEYDRLFEKNYIIVSNKYAKVIKDFIPNYWGILEVVGKNKKRLEYIRHAQFNPNIEFDYLLGILSAEDLKNIALANNFHEKLSLSKTEFRKLFKQTIINLLSVNLNKTEKNKLSRQIKLHLKQ